jgi:tetratricopeptide (TPR) repeat protein
MKKHNKNSNHTPLPRCFSFAIFAILVTISGCASQGVTSAEEYYAIGMAYFELGKFAEAEQWLNRARSVDKTKSASEYNLGRIAFATGRYEDAVRHFEGILKRDPENVLALKAAAYTRIKTGEIEKAESHYQKLLTLVPESVDDGYNYALVLYAMEKYTIAEEVLNKYPFALLDNSDVLLLYARAQKAQGKVEAVDSYARWLDNNSEKADPKVRYEYAELLETGELFARALEEYRVTLSGLTQTSVDPSRADVRFAIARVLLIADSESSEGISELEEAVKDGFADIEAIEKIVNDERVSAANKNSLNTIIAGIQRAALDEAEKAAEAARAAEAAADEAEKPEDESGDTGNE